MGLMRSLLLRASRSTWLERQMRSRPFARRAVRRFLPGETLADALAAARTLADHGLSSVLTQLGENVSTADEVRAVTRHYQEVLAETGARRLPAEISVKLTHLGLDLDGDLCREQVDALAESAARHGTSVWIDMESSAYVDRTLAIFRSLRERHANVGVCVQAYLYRTAQDLDDLAPLEPRIRLVKGAYQEAAAVAFPKKRDVDANYFALARRLLDDARFRAHPGPAFGTHDLPLVRRVAAHAAERGVSRDGFEVQMLYGVRSADQRALAAEGFAVRTLISYGDHWFPWYMRRLAERPANVWFVVRTMFG